MYNYSWVTGIGRKEAELDWEIKYLPEEGIVSVKTAGELIDLEENQRLITDILTEAVKHGAKKVFLDDRDLRLKIAAADIYYLPDTFKNMGLSREYKVAIVFEAIDQDGPDFKFYETRMANMGYNHRIFTDTDAALAWLSDRGA